MRVLMLQSPLFRLLGFSDDRIGVAITHDAALLEAAGIDVAVLNLDADPAGLAGTYSWRELAEASGALANIAEAEELRRVLDELTAAVEQHEPDAAVVYSGDWAVPAKDISAPSVDMRLGRHLRSLGVRATCVGFHCTLRPTLFAEAFDSVVVGVPGRALISAVRGRRGLVAGASLDEYTALLPAIDSVWPRSDTSRTISEFGCPYGRCRFCPSAVLFRGARGAKAPKLFAADVARRREQTIHIVDNDFGRDVERLGHLAPLLGRLNRSYVVDLRSEAAECLEVLGLLRQMNTTTVKIGVESLSDAVLARMNKGQRVSQVVERLRRFYREGFNVFAYLLLGTPGDTLESMTRTIERAEELDFVHFLPNIFCRPGDTDSRAHHFSLPQAERLGIPSTLVERALRLHERGRGQASPSERRHPAVA